MIAIDLNDAAIAVADSSGVVAVEPGCAVVSEDGIVSGREALHRARARPRHFRDRYWFELNTDALALPLPGARSHADLAYAQLDSIWQAHTAAKEVILCVPGCFDRDRLGLLLGVAKACGMPVGGLVDAAVASSGRESPGSDCIHLEAHRHSIGATRLVLDGGSQVAESWLGLADFGVAELHERWGRRIASEFVRQTRFDPFVTGASEQAFFDAFPAWLRRLGRDGAASLEFEWAEVKRTLPLTLDALLDDTPELIDAITRGVASAQRPGRDLVVRLGPVLARLPGVAAAIERIERVNVFALPEGAAALGALRFADRIRSDGDPDGVALVNAIALWDVRDGSSETVDADGA